MPVSFQLERGAVVLEMIGEYSTSDIERALTTALAQANGESLRGLLFDVSRSDALAHRSVDQVRGMARFLSAHAPAYGGRLALVARSDLQFGFMRLGGTYTELAGVATHVFRSADDAWSWLAA